MSVEVKIDFDSIRIYLNDTIHVYIKRADFVGFQGWLNGGDTYAIEFYMKDGATILTEQNTKEKWIAILNELDKTLKGVA